MKRKVVKHGPSTFIISLPAKWVKKHRVQKGDSLEVLMRGQSLVVSKRLAEEERILEIDLHGKPHAVVREAVRKAYRDGYDRLQITHRDTEILEVIQEATNELLGFAIMEQDEERCVVQAITRDVDLTFEESVDETYQQIAELLRNAQNAHKLGDQGALKALPLKAQSIRKLTNFCMRALFTGTRGPTAELRPDLVTEIDELGEIGQAALRIVERLDIARDPELLKALDELATLAEQVRRLRNGEGDPETILEQHQRTDERLSAFSGPAAARALAVADRLNHLTLAHVLAAREVRSAALEQERQAGELAA